MAKTFFASARKWFFDKIILRNVKAPFHYDFIDGPEYGELSGTLVFFDVSSGTEEEKETGKFKFTDISSETA
ncbi:MAG: hypothetical protein Q4D17_00095 [Planctomycetia bacterium]|nr:hypothetical protein [Planctomycetia bacterium]